MPLDELLAKYQRSGGEDDDDDDEDDEDAHHFLYSPASLSDVSETSDGKYV